jgi:AGZA family xanthine/uracil permease-like MFS transporter
VESDVPEVPRSEPARAAPSGGGLDSYFKLSERGTSVGTEVRAGLTTFLVMAYIIFLNPLILSNMIPEGPDRGAFITAASAATALLAGILTIAMGVVSNYPIALAAGLGINAIVAFTLVLGLGLSPAGAMGVIVLEGLIVLVLVLVGLREAIMDAVPLALKRAIGVGIGLFILFIGFVDGAVQLPGRAGHMGLRAGPGADDRVVCAQSSSGPPDQHHCDVDLRLHRRPHRDTGEHGLRAGLLHAR